MAKKKHADTIESMELCEGVYLQEEFFEKKENRVLTLLLKGFIVYLLSMGSIGFYLTAFDISFHVGLCHALILLTSLGCAMLYYRLMVENLGYLFLFVTFAFLVFTFRDYINSGFYAIVNITVDNAAQYFDVDIQRLYEEKIGNRYVTVTFVALFIGIVLDILLNVYISRRMQYVTAIVIIMCLNLIPLYLTMEPDLLYVLMMLAGVAMAIIFKAGKHYSPQVSVKRSNAQFQVQGKKKKEVAYVYDVKAMVQAGVLAVVTAILVVTAASSFRPKESFNVGYTGNKYKDLTMKLSTLKTERSNLTVTSKYNGIVSGTITKGKTISKGQSVCKVLKTSSYKVTINVDELDIKSVKKGQSVTVTADAVEDKTFTGKVTKVSKVGSTSDGVATYPVTIQLSNAADLLPSMSVTATITTAKAENAVLVPVSAIQTKDGESYVTVVMDDNENGTQTKVETGIINDTYAQITSGVSEGDQIKTITRSSSNSDEKSNMKGGMYAPSGGGMQGGNRQGGGMPYGGKQ